MIDGLVGGRLSGEASWATGKSGKRFVRARVRADTGRGGTLMVNVAAFERSVQEVLLALKHGDSLTLTGPLIAKLYQDKAGETKQSLDMTAHGVLTPFHVGQVRAAAAPREDAGVGQKGFSPGDRAGSEEDSEKK